MEEILTKEKQRELAIKRLQQMDIYEPYIKAFKDECIVTMFENFGGFWATEWNGEEGLENKIRRFEEESGNLVYAVTHDFTDFGELYSFLIISKYAGDEHNELLENGNGEFYPFAYVWNKTADYCSEYGTIGVKSAFGGIRRVE